MSKKPEKKPEAGAPMWIVTFADLSTLMLTFFVLLLSFASMDIVKFREMLGSVKGAFGVRVEGVGKPVPFISGEEVFDKEKDTSSLSAEAEAKLRETQTKLDSLVMESKLKDNIIVMRRENALVIRIDGGVFFKPGASKMTKAGFRLLKGLAEFLKRTDHSVTVEGHTDSIPISTKMFPSNWELSGIRATTVLRYLLTTGISNDRLRAIGYSDTRPVADNDTPEGRGKNRRVEFILKQITSPAAEEAPQG
ncbi:MAG: flagellar motor protein MotB [Nitrospinota bacterium]